MNNESRELKIKKMAKSMEEIHQSFRDFLGKEIAERMDMEIACENSGRICPTGNKLFYRNYNQCVNCPFKVEVLDNKPSKGGIV